jgi:iron complex outermembrane receptor protein
MEESKKSGKLRALLALALAPLATAQDDEAFTLSPFTVEATRGYTATSTISGTGLNTPLANVPMSINVITSDFLDDSNIGDFEKALDYNSSITQTTRQGGNNARPSTFSIRGFRNRNNLIDGVSAGTFFPSQMIDRIEVVKGPNTLYGQSDPGGLINVITKTPQAQEGGRVTFKAGEHGWIQGQADVTVRAMDDKLGLRILTDYKELDGWYALDGSTSKFLGLSGDYDLTENSDFTFLVSGNEIQQIPTQRSTFGFEERMTDLNGDGDFDDTVRQIKEARARYNNSFVPKNFTTMTQDNSHNLEQDYLSLGYRLNASENNTLQYKYNFYETDSEVNFRAFNTFRASDGRSDANYSTQRSRARDEVHTLNDIIRFNTGEAKHQLLLGYRKSESTSYSGGTWRLRATRANEAAILDDLEAQTGKTLRRFLFKDEVLAGARVWEERSLSNAVLRANGIRTNNIDRSFQDVDTIYATDNIYLMEDRLNILLGVRNVDIQQHTIALGGAPRGSTVDVSDTSFQFGAVYRINPTVSAFVNIADAFEPNTVTNPDTGDFFTPQMSDAIEVGVKFVDLYDGRLSGSVALFNIQKANVVRNDFNPVTFTSDQAITSDESEGIELELFANPIDNWDMTFAYSFIDGRVVGAISPELEGLRLEGATPHRLTFFNSYTISEGSMEGLRFGGGIVWAKGPIQQFGTPKNALVAEDGYTTVDLFARYPTEIGGRQVTFGVNIDNANDAFFARSRGAFSAPRTVLFSVSTDL